MTVVVQGRSCLFGDAVDAEMRFNEAGQMARRVWEALPHRFSGIEIDPFVVMPNHIHTIIVLHGTVGASLVGARPTPNRATTRVAPASDDVVSEVCIHIVTFHRQYPTHIHHPYIHRSQTAPTEPP